MPLITTQRAAEILGVSRPRVYQLIQLGRLPATKIGRDYVIQEKLLKNVKVFGHAGRPAKLKPSGG